MRCSGAVLLRAADNGRLYCTWKATLLAARPAWCTARGLRALHQRGLAVRHRDCRPRLQRGARAKVYVPGYYSSLTFPQKISWRKLI